MRVWFHDGRDESLSDSIHLSDAMKGRTYWRLRVNTKFPWKEHVTEIVYFWTDKPLGPAMIAREAVREKMMIDVWLPYVDQVCRITKEEYFDHMWE